MHIFSVKWELGKRCGFGFTEWQSVFSADFEQTVALLFESVMIHGFQRF